MFKDLNVDIQTSFPAGFVPVSKPSQELLDACERELEFRLPKSYWEFLEEFGPGDFGEFFRFYSPLSPGDAMFLDLRVYNKSIHEGDSFLASNYDQPQLIPRLIYFSNTYGGDSIGWDSNHLLDPANIEYPIYGIPRVGNKVATLASSFPSLLHSILDGSALKVLGYSDPGSCPAIFQPWVKPVNNPSTRTV